MLGKGCVLRAKTDAIKPFFKRTALGLDGEHVHFSDMTRFLICHALTDLGTNIDDTHIVGDDST